MFTWNTTRFKDPSAYFHAMQDKGAENVPNIKPGILLCHPWFEEFKSQDVFVKDSKNPEQYAVGSWWGGPGAFWDFTKPAARGGMEKICDREAWLLWEPTRSGMTTVSMTACWIRMLLQTLTARAVPSAQLKPMMSTLMCKLSNDAVKEHDADIRPYSVCRAEAAASRRYAQTWCGDNYTSWKSLKYNIPAITGMGLSGQPNEGVDIGGFAGPAPEEELFVGAAGHFPGPVLHPLGQQ